MRINLKYMLKTLSELLLKYARNIENDILLFAENVPTNPDAKDRH